MDRLCGCLVVIQDDHDLGVVNLKPLWDGIRQLNAGDGLGGVGVGQVDIVSQRLLSGYGGGVLRGAAFWIAPLYQVKAGVLQVT